MTLEELIQELNSIRQLRGGDIAVSVTVNHDIHPMFGLIIAKVKADTESNPYVVKISVE